MKLENRFGEYIYNLRTEKNISQDQLSDGLCDSSMLSRFEKGEREPDKLLQNRFLTRLGAVPENYENFLFYKEYCRWERRQGIIHNILEENMDRARECLEAYRLEYDMNEALEKQFYLAMLAQVKQYEGAKEEELANLFGEALLLTVPDVEVRGFAERLLSLEEINLLLEYVHCSVLGNYLETYRNILTYIEKVDRTLLAMAKIYPKTVYYYYLAWEKRAKKDTATAKELFVLCDKAIEILRDANRMFYLWELFGMREVLIAYLPEEMKEKEGFQERFEQCVQWRETLEEIYHEFGVTIKMYEFCYLYVESENYCIGDVIRIRRKMLGLSMKKLSEGICSEKTISRLERNEVQTQREIVQMLFDRLNLSMELCRTELVTESREALEIYRELKFQNNVCNYRKVDELLGELKQLISLDIPSNRQVILRNEAHSRRNKIINSETGEKNAVEEYTKYVKQALECTVSYNAATKLGEKYLTNEEITCLQNILLETVGSSCGEECAIALIELVQRKVFPNNYLRMYELITNAVAAYYGSKGYYDYSDEIEIKTIKLLLKSRRLGGIHEILYELLWNDVKKKAESGETICERVYRCELTKCLNISKFCKALQRTKDYQERLA